MNLSRKKIFSIVAGSVILGALAYVIWGGLESNMVYFVTPAELAAKGSQAVGNPVRLGGVVAPDSVHFQDNTLSFRVTDDVKTVPVITTKTPPQMFQEGMGVVVEGAMQADGRFNAERLMIKHGNEYRPPEEGKMPQEIYQQLQNPGNY